MARKIGEHEITLEYDGKKLPAQARSAAAAAGKLAGDEFEDSFTNQLSDMGQSISRKMRASGKTAGANFADSMRSQVRSRLRGLTNDVAAVFANKRGLDDYARGFDSIGDAATRLRADLVELSKNNAITDRQLEATRRRIDQWEGPARRAEASTRAFNAEMRKLGDAQTEASAMNAEFDRMQRSIDQAHQQAIKLNRAVDLKEARFDSKELSRNIRELTATMEADSRSWDLNTDRVASYRRELGRAQTEAIKMNVEFDRMRASIGRAGDGVDRESHLLRGFGRAIALVKKQSDGFHNRWRNLPHGLKQFAFYTALFASLAGEIAILGSAAGSSLAVLLTGATALGAGIGVLVAGFIGITGEMDKIAPAARPASRALRDMGRAFSDIRQTIQGRLFDGLEQPIRNLTSRLLPSLDRGLGKTADTMNRFLRRLSDGLTAPASLSRLDRIFDGLQPILENLTDLVINLGGALARVIEGAIPITTNFTRTLSDAVARFNAFLDTDAGQRRLVLFFQTLERVAGAVQPLLEATGNLLANLVNEKSLTRFENTLDYLTRFTPALEGLLQAIGGLDPIGIIAELLFQFGEAISPILPDLERLGEAINDNVGPILQTASDILRTILEQLVPGLADFFENLNPGLETFFGLVSEEANASRFDDTATSADNLKTALGDLGTTISDFFESDFVKFLFDENAQPASGLNSLSTGINDAGREFGNFVRGAGAEFMNFLDDIRGGGPDLFAGLLIGLSTFFFHFGVGFQGLSTTVALKFAEMGVAAQTGWTNLTTGTSLGLEAVKQAAAMKLAGLLVNANTTWTNLQTGASIAFSLMSSSANTKVGEIQGFFASLPGRVQGAISSLPGIASGIFNQLPAPAQAVISRIISFFSSLPGEVGRVVSGIPGAFARGIGGIVGEAQAVVDRAVAVFEGLKRRVEGIVSSIKAAAQTALSAATGGLVAPPTAVGGVFDRAQTRLIGEAGPEAVVPLNRPLNQVDPAVRALSAFAQGLSMPEGGGSSSTDARRMTTVEAGAIQVVSPLPEYSGEQVLDALVANL